MDPLYHDSCGTCLCEERASGVGMSSSCSCRRHLMNCSASLELEVAANLAEMLLSTALEARNGND